MTGTYCNALLIEQSGQILIVQGVAAERNNGNPVAAGADAANAINLVKPLLQFLTQLVLMLGDRFSVETAQKIDSGCQANCSGNRGCTRFKTQWWGTKCGAREADPLNHLAAPLPWRHIGQQLTPTVEYADTRGTIDFMAGEGIKITTQRLYIDRKMTDSLRAIDQSGDVVPMSCPNDLFDGIYGAQSIGDMGDSQQFHLGALQ